MLLISFLYLLVLYLPKKIKSDVNPLLYVDNNVNSIATFEVTSNRVRNVILSLNNSSAGHDELPPFVAKSCIEEFIEPLTYMNNESLRTGICPSELNTCPPDYLGKFSKIEITQLLTNQFK